MIRGTSISVRFSRAIDGDTIRVFLPGAAKDESVRILSVDTEESFSMSSTKPVTPWGKEAKSYCRKFFRGVSTVTLEFPDNSPLDEALRIHRGSFGRLLVYVWREADGIDYSEILIRKGFSPYYMKYGHAHFAGHRARYERAERLAQCDGLGIWDMTGTVNGGTRYNNYALLKSWWNIRADAIEEFRKVQRVGDTSVLTPDRDYDRIVELSKTTDQTHVVTVFTKVSDLRVGETYASISIGQRNRPMSVYIPHVSKRRGIEDEDEEDDDDDNGVNGISMGSEEESKGRQVVNLLLNRYVDEGMRFPRRGFAFLSGTLRTFRGNPQLVVDDPMYVRDTPGPRPQAGAGVVSTIPEDMDEDVPPAAVERAEINVRVAAVLPDPAGGDSGNEVVTLAITAKTDGEVTLKGWKLRDACGRMASLSNVAVDMGDGVGVGDEVLKEVRPKGLTLNNTGDSVFVLDDEGRVVNRVDYTSADVKAGVAIQFPPE